MEDNKTVVSEELEKSLRDAVDGYINSRLNGLQEEIARLQSQVNEAFTRLLERSSSETQSDTSIAVSISESDILNTLVNTAASFAPRVVFFVVKNEQAVGWRGRGLEGTVGDNSVREIVLPLSADTPLSDVVRSRATWSGTPGANAEDHLLLNKLGTEPPQRIVAVPLIARGKAVAVLYADSAALESDA